MRRFLLAALLAGCAHTVQPTGLNVEFPADMDFRHPALFMCAFYPPQLLRCIPVLGIEPKKQETGFADGF